MPSAGIKDIPLFHDLSAKDAEQLKTVLHEKELKKGEVILSEGSPCERIFIVQSGRIKLYRMTSSGREQILEMLGPGDTCACNPGSMSWFCSATAEAVTPAKLWFLARDQYVKLVENNAKVSKALNRIFANKLQCLSSLVEEVSLKDAKKRLVKFLLDMASKKKGLAAGASTLFISFTREELAQRIGTARETVTRHLHQLKRSRLIEIKPHQITILDKAGLEKLI